MSEHQEQAALIQWFRGQYPKGLIFAVPNAAKRNVRVAAYMKAEGLTAGVPDLVIPMPRGLYHGLFIELKKTKGKNPSDSQEWWLEQLNLQGYKAVCCKGFDIAQQTIKEYIGSA